jgi:hypothetical protein
VEFVLPTDVVVADKFSADASHKVVPVDAIPDGWMVSGHTMQLLVPCLCSPVAAAAPAMQPPACCTGCTCHMRCCSLCAVLALPHIREVAKLALEPCSHL